MVDAFVAFIAISLVVIVTPGQDTALTIRNTLAGGQRGGVMTALGVAGGQAVWALATALGVVAFLVTSEPLFAAVKLAGACYIGFLGLQSLYAALRPSQTAANGTGAPAGPGLSPMKALRQGVVSNLGNPKMAVFFASLLPQFAPAGTSTFAGLAMLGLIFCLMTFVWLTGYAIVVTKAGDVLRRPRIRRSLEGLTGAALLGLGIHIVAVRE